MIMGFGIGGKRMDDKLDAISKTVNETHTSMQLLLQDHGNTKERQQVVESEVKDIKQVQSEHGNTLEKLEKFSGSHNKKLEVLESQVNGMSGKMSKREPFWDVLGVLWQRFLWLACGVAAAWVLKMMGVM